MMTETEISYEMVDATAAEDGALSVTDKQSWADLDELHDHTDGRTTAGKWATCEPDEFILDGTFELLPADPSEADTGLWSQSQSGADRMFSVPPVLAVTFSQPHTSLGITLTFSASTGDWCSDLTVRWYDADGALLAERDFTPDKAVYFCDKLVQDYYKIMIIFRATNKPYRFLKLFRIDYGLIENLTDSRITEASLLEEADPISATISVNTFRFGFHADRRFDLLDLTGAYAVFQQQQIVRVRQKVDGVRRNMGLFFTDAPSVEDQRIVTIDCIDYVGLMDQAEYMGGLWLDGITAGDLLADIMQSAGIVDYEIDAELAAATVKGYLPVNTHREALRQLAFAVGAMVTCARGDKLHVIRAPTAASSTIQPHDKVTGHYQEQREYVSGVEVYVHDYVLGGLSNNTTELFSADCDIGEQLVKFSSPATKLSCSGASILESGVNYARLNVTVAGMVTLTGRVYEDQTSLGGSVYAAQMPAGARVNVKTFEDCTLSADPQQTAQRLYDYYQRRVEDTGDLFPVAAAAGDKVELQTAGGRTLTGIVESMDIDLYGGGIAKAVVVGG